MAESITLTSSLSNFPLDILDVIIDKPSLEQAVRRTSTNTEVVEVMSVRVWRFDNRIQVKVVDTAHRTRVESMSLKCDRCLATLLVGEHTVARLASEHHVSERAMYRRLKRLYKDLHVSGRSELRQCGTHIVSLASSHFSCQFCRSRE